MELHGRVATRYARAIVEWVGPNEKAKKIAEELQSFGQLISENAELRLALTTSVFSEEDRKAVLEDLFKSVSLNEETKRVVLVVSELKRLKSLPAIAHRLSQLLLTQANVIPIDVESSSALSNEEKKVLEGRFAKVLNSPVSASYMVTPALVGGLKVTANGKTYDGTLSGWLNQVEEVLVGGNI